MVHKLWIYISNTVNRIKTPDRPVKKRQIPKLKQFSLLPKLKEKMSNRMVIFRGLSNPPRD